MSILLDDSGAHRFRRPGKWLHKHVRCSYVSHGWRMFQAWFTVASSSTARPFLLLEDPGDLGALRTS
jgi:hypothetical protein